MNAVEQCACEEPQICNPLRWLKGRAGRVLLICNRCFGCYLDQAFDMIEPDMRHVIWEQMGIDFTEPT